MATRPLILLPPSEAKTPGGTSRSSKDRFADELGTSRMIVRAALSEALDRLSGADLGKLLRVRGALFERAQSAMCRIVDEDAPVMPAWRRYSGVVWEHLDPSTISASARSRILVPSALYGINSAEDAIADYRLTMHSTLSRIGNLARFWRPELTELLCSVRGNPTIVSLLPAEHARSIDMSQLGNVVQVQFVQPDGQGAAGHHAKAAKGRFARHLVDNGLCKAAHFQFEGWKITRSTEGFVLRAPK